MLPSEGSHLDDPNHYTYPHMSAHHEDHSKTANMSWKDQQGKCLSATFFLKDNVVGEKANSTVDFKVISFEKFTVWEIAARSLDFSSVAIENLCC